MNLHKEEVKLKLLIVGDSGVGKTSILMRYTQNQFSTQYLSTIGIDFKVKKIDTQTHRVSLQLWDTAGQERFRTLTKTFYKGSNGVVLVYSITDQLSFTHIQSWLTQIKNNCEGEAVVLLLGCKDDLEEQRQVSKQEGEQIAKLHGITFKQVSAKLNTGLDQSFDLLTRQIIQTMSHQALKGSCLNKKKQKIQKSRCC